MPITRETNGTLKLGGIGEPVEMVRFNEDDTLDQLAARGLIDMRLANALGLAVAAAHRSAPVVDATPWISALEIFIDQNNAAFRSAPALFLTSCADEITALSREALLRIRPLLLARGELGFVRRGHGDLHLGNIVMIKGRPVLFDAIEFDPIVAAGDVLYDLAFLLMDLMERDLKDAANLVFNRYLSEVGRSENFDALAALPLFLSLRAAIRAKVTAARLEMVPSTDARRVGVTAQTYFRYALDVLKPPRPVLIAIGEMASTVGLTWLF